jgi:hypothetical protein
MTSWARVGAKCVCVDADSPSQSGIWQGDRLVAGSTYTIVAVTSSPVGLVGVKVLEADTPNPFGYWLARFRPLVTISQAQDVAKFRHLLTPSPVDAGLVPAGVELVE